MEYLIGLALALAVCGLAGVAGFDRDRVFYPTMLIPVATYYILFAVMAGSTPALARESVAAGLFILLAGAGFARNLWWAVAGLAGHGLFDLLHPLLIANPGVPLWWPGFCLAYDVLAAGFLAMLLRRRSQFASRPA
ncbi:MAG: hypothetical protein JNK87_22385 [Bryobacterales bacterium]|nr:hypothetical protein [Bryobacterales bacterium]